MKIFATLTRHLRRIVPGLLSVLLAMMPLLGFGQTPVNITTARYDELFDGMGATGTTYVPGWTGLRFAGSGTVNATLSPVVDNGSSTSGNVFNVGTTGAADRALGSLASGTTVPRFGAAFKNTAGAVITQLALTGFMEQWRAGSNAVVETLPFEYSLDATSLNTGTWTAAAGMDLVEKLTADNGNAAKDGNLAANRTAIAATITGLAIADNATFWIRWTDTNDAGSDGLYAVDGFSLTATVGAAPTTSISTGTITTTAYCVGATDASNPITVPFTATGAFTTGNVYTAFIGTTSVGTLASTASGALSIAGAIPSTVASGTHRVRVDASAPATTGTTGASNDITVVNYKTNEVTAYTATPGNTTVDLAWTRPSTCVTRVVVIARQGSAPSVKPSGTFAASAAFGSGTDLGGGLPGQFVVYDGTGTSVQVTNLTNSSQYFFQAYTTNGDGYSDGAARSATPAPPTTLTEVLLPQFVVGHAAGATSHTERLPYAFRATLSGLTPGATYRYYNSVIDANDPADGPTTVGSGNVIFPVAAGGFVRTTGAALTTTTANTFGTLQANGTGSYTGWFVLEPSGNARFDAGKTLKMRIILNDGNNGSAAVSFLTTTSTVAVRQFGTGPAQATGIAGSSFAPASNFVFTYDNVGGTGRPLAGTFVESDGTANVAGTYAAFYAASVEAQAGAYGLLTPNDNANGIRYVAQYELTTGAPAGCAATDADGLWPGGAVTASPSSGSTPQVLTRPDAPLTCDVYVGFNPATRSLPEGNSGTTTVNVNVTVSNAPAGTLTVTVSDAGTGTATAGTDYTFAPQTLTFTSAGTQTVALVVNGDLTPEANETVQLTLTASGAPATVLNSTATVTIRDDDTLPPAVLLLEEDFDYPAGTQLASSTTVPDPVTGWVVQGSATPVISTVVGNVLKNQYPKGAALSNVPAGTSTQVALANNGQDVNKSFSRTGVTTVLYATAVVSVSAAQDNGDYFLHLFNATTPGLNTFRGKVFARSVVGAPGAINFGLSVSANANAAGQVYGSTAYALNTPYLVVVKYENSPATGGTDAVSLFVLDDANPATPGVFTPQTEPATALVGPLSSTATDFADLNAIALRQGSPTGSAAAATLTVDGLRVATAWGPAVGRPVYMTPAITVAAGNYYDLAVNNADAVTTTGAVNIERELVLASGRLVTSAANPVLLYVAATPTVTSPNGSSFVDGPLARATAATAATVLFPIGKTTFYRPLTLTLTAQTAASTYTAEQVEGNPGQAFVPGNGLGSAPLLRVSRFRSFTLASSVTTSGNATGTVTLSFGAGDAVNDPADPGLVVAAGGPPFGNISRSAFTGTGTGPGGAAVAGTLTSASISTLAGAAVFVLGATNDNITFGQAINPLPVELTTFTAERVSSGVSVRWATASEKSSACFEVQRSLGGQEFATVARATAQGSSSQATTYAALDQTVPAGRLYYRLRQVDRDGTAAYSPVVTVAGLPTDLVLYPNPAHTSLHVPGAPATPYRVLDQLGRAQLQGTTDVGTGTVQVGPLAPGLYLLELHTGTGRIVRKFVKE